MHLENETHAGLFETHAGLFETHAGLFETHAVLFETHAVLFETHAVLFETHAVRLYGGVLYLSIAQLITLFSIYSAMRFISWRSRIIRS